MIIITCKNCDTTIRINENVKVNPVCSNCGSNEANLTIVDGSNYIRGVCGLCNAIDHYKTGLVSNFICSNGCRPPFKTFYKCKGETPKEDTLNLKLKEIEAEPTTMNNGDEFPVSVIVLCHNQLKHTQKCINDIRINKPKEIILVDNNSTDGTTKWAEKQKDIIYIRNRVNLGCGIGRNQGVKWATQKYILFLDNDQYIPKDLIKRMLLVNSDIIGIELWKVEKLDCSTKPVKNGIPDYNTYIGSGGLFIRKLIFERLGGYDERFSPAWYEDSDFCFRLVQNGYKYSVMKNSGVKHIGNSTINNQKDFDERKAKEESRKLFSTIWKTFLDKGGDTVLFGNGLKLSKPKVAIIADVKGWAWDFKARQIQKYLCNEFDISIYYLGQTDEAFKADILFTFECDNISKYQNHKRFITGVTAHTYTNFAGHIQALKSATAIHANSKMLFNEIEQYNMNCFYVPNGVDEDKFPYTKRNTNRAFKVGYVGKDIPRKGLNNYIKPACIKANVELVIQSCRYNDDNKIEHNDMKRFYENIDCIVIASDMDGTPNQLLESASCGRTFISNEIGNVPEFHNSKNGIIVKYRDVDLYAKELKKLKKNRSKCAEMGTNARKTIEENWTWKIQSEYYRKMFNEVLNK